MKIEGNFEATLWRHRWCHHHEKKHFFDIIWDDLFISEVRLNLCFLYQNFQNGRHFQLTTNFFTGIYTGSWLYKKESHEHFQHFELLIDALTRRNINFKIWPTLWSGDVINDVMNMYSYKCSHNLMILMQRKFNDDIFARFLAETKQLYEWYFLSVCPSICLSVRHTFLTMFPSSYHHEIFRSYHHGPG